MERICLERWGNSEIEKKVGEGVDYSAHRFACRLQQKILLELPTIRSPYAKSFVAFLQNTIQRFLIWVKNVEERRRHSMSSNNVRMVSISNMTQVLRKHLSRLRNTTGLTPGDVRVLSQDLLKVLGEPLPERVTALLAKVLDLSPRGGQVWLGGWLERAITKCELIEASGLHEMEPGYLGLLLEPVRVPGEGRQAGE